MTDYRYIAIFLHGSTCWLGNELVPDIQLDKISSPTRRTMLRCEIIGGTRLRWFPHWSPAISPDGHRRRSFNQIVLVQNAEFVDWRLLVNTDWTILRTRWWLVEYAKISVFWLEHDLFAPIENFPEMTWFSYWYPQANWPGLTNLCHGFCPCVVCAIPEASGYKHIIFLTTVGDTRAVCYSGVYWWPC